MEIYHESTLAQLVKTYRAAASKLRSLQRRNHTGQAAINAYNVIKIVEFELKQRQQPTLVEALQVEADNVTKIHSGAPIDNDWHDQVREARTVIRFKLQREHEEINALPAQPETPPTEEDVEVLEAEFLRLLSHEDGSVKKQVTLAEEKALERAALHADTAAKSKGFAEYSPRWYGAFINHYKAQLQHYTRLYRTEADDLHEAWLEEYPADLLDVHFSWIKPNLTLTFNADEKLEGKEEILAFVEDLLEQGATDIRIEIDNA